MGCSADILPVLIGMHAWAVEGVRCRVAKSPSDSCMKTETEKYHQP